METTFVAPECPVVISLIHPFFSLFEISGHDRNPTLTFSHSFDMSLCIFLSNIRYIGNQETTQSGHVYLYYVIWLHLEMNFSDSV